MRIAILTHGEFPEHAKTGIGILRYGDENVVAVLDRERAGDRVGDHIPDVQDAPIVAEMSEVPDCDALVIGISPIGGEFEESWRPDILAALERGCDIVSGLHTFLSEDEQFRSLAAEHGCRIRDVRKPPADLSVAEGTAGDIDARRVLTVGTDCSTGKMTASFELRDAARARGLDAAVVPTGQTGIMITGRGIAIDRTISDFAAGAVERIVEQARDHEILFIEGQGALAHPAYSGVTTALLHGAQPESLVFCHLPGHDRIRKYEQFQIPSPRAYADLYEQLSAPVSNATVDAGMLNTSELGPQEASKAIDAFESELGVPATDPVRFDADDVLDSLL